MRPTDLQFRFPEDHRTDYNIEYNLTRDGHNINIVDGTRQNPKGYSLPQAHRFGGIMGFYDKGTG